MRISTVGTLLNMSSSTAERIQARDAPRNSLISTQNLDLKSTILALTSTGNFQLAGTILLDQELACQDRELMELLSMSVIIEICMKDLGPAEEYSHLDLCTKLLKKWKTKLGWDLLFGRACEIAADSLMDRLLEMCQPSKHELEKAIVSTYTRANQWKKIIKILSQKPADEDLIMADLLSPAAYSAVFIGRLTELRSSANNPQSAGGSLLSSPMINDSGFDFDSLKSFLSTQGLFSSEGMPKNAIDALESLLAQTIAPESFLSFLENKNFRSTS